MIEYALLFALGFLTASLIAVAIAPAIHRRIVAYTERRLYATMPISPEEVRAQKDMERAVFAAEAARLGQDLRTERERRLEAARHTENLSMDAARLTTENAELGAHIEEMNTAAADLRAELRRATMQNGDLKAALNLSQTTIDTLRREIELHEERERRLETDASGYRLDLAAREAENESLAARLQAARHERDALRNDYRQSAASLSELELRSGHSEGRLARLEQKVLRQAADLADMENRLERRSRDAENLRERLRAAQREKETYRMTLKAAGIDAPSSEPAPATEQAAESATPSDTSAQETERLAARSQALVERILTSSDGDDDRLREELAELAAEVTAHAGEGKAAERIRDILIASPPAGDGGRVSLASRIKGAMAAHELGKN